MRMICIYIYYIMVECISVSLSVTKKWPPVGLLVMYICCPNCTGFSLLLTLAGTWLALASLQRHQLKASYNHNECILLWWWWSTVKCWYMLIRLVIEDGWLSVGHKIGIFLRAEREAWEVYSWELYHLDDPPRPSRPKAGLGLGIDNDDDHPSILQGVCLAMHVGRVGFQGAVT